MFRKLIMLSIVVAVIGGGVATSTAQAENLSIKCPSVAKGVVFYKKATWRWQDVLGKPHTKASRSAIRSCKYGKWVAELWRVRAKTERRWINTLEHANHDFAQASQIASSIWPDITTQRLWDRASLEGGHGGWVENRQGSGANGWFQFKEGTYYGRSGEAFRDAAARGYFIPAKYNSWYSVLGQNVTAAYMFHIGLECSGEGWAASC